ncbi:MAG: hypothetical protein NZ528_13100 [Caldilineales bacterium]|nr:hypothetical protein [Caldilineales bacterium]
MRLSLAVDRRRLYSSKCVKATAGSATTVYPATALRAGIGNSYERDNGGTVRK